MHAWLTAAAPAVLLALAVLYCRYSGNDKAPFVVLLVLALDAGLVLFLLMKAWMQSAPFAWRHAMVAALPLLYAAAVLWLARLGWLDPLPLLGFR